VVFDPPKDELFTAVRGGGAFLNGEPLRCTQVTELGQALVATGFGYDARRRAAQAAILPELLPTVRDIRRVGAGALDLCAVAAGRVDAYYEQGMSPWDWTAGELIAIEAGARVGGLRGTPVSSAMVVAAAPGVFDALHDLLVRHDADADPLG
jgi:myo-inositol-1(or 4)-monophosphatase